jgi:hypothetical protein
MDETKAIPANEIVSDPHSVYSLQQQFILLKDYSMNQTYVNFVAAINILAEAGWEISQLTSDNMYLYALCHNPNYKRKQTPEE